MTGSAAIEAVLWDFGGVLTSSPFDAFNRYEAQHGLPQDFIRTINATNPETNAWAQFESSQISAEQFDALFQAEAREAGHDVPGAEVLALLSGDLRPRVVAALQACKAVFKVGCITNNVKSGQGPGMARSSERAAALAKVMALFDVVVESSVEGVRKPEPEIYRIACQRLGIEPSRTIFLDDLGVNLKPARAMGMHTIKVLNEQQALDELAGLTGLPIA
ncbi:MAG: HAD-IA family hydrolase [Pseudomonadales bacterium]